MKTISSYMNRPRHQRNAAFTLVEMMTGVGLFLVIFVGMIVGLQLFGLRVYTLAATKISATADARKSLNALRGHIRSAKVVYVGNYADGNFSRITNGLPQEGNALEIFFTSTNNTASDTPVIYYQNSSGSENGLYSVSNNMVSQLAGYVTNHYVFAAEDYRAETLTTYDNNPVIRVTLQFYQWEYPIGFIGTNGVNAYNFYRLQTRVSRRARE